MADADDIRTDLKDGAKNRKVFTSNHEMWGLPSKVAIGGLLMCGLVFFMSKWWMALIMGVVYFPPMIAIHKDDAKALDVWLAAFRDGVGGWQAGLVRARELIVLDDDQ